MTHSNNASLSQITKGEVLRYYADKILTNFYQRNQIKIHIIPSIYIITNNSRDAINSHKYKISSQNYKLYPLSRESEGKKTREKQKEKKKKKNSIPTGKKNHVTFDKGHR